MSAGSLTPKRPGSKPKGAVRAKSGCYTCRIRRKKCDEKPDAEGSCQTCVRLRLQCLGFGAKRPDWMREGNSVTELRGKIKGFLAQNGMIKGHSASASASSLRSPGLLSTPGASTSASSTSPPTNSLPPLQSVTASATTELSTPVSATSTLTPEQRSVSPPSPSGSHPHSHSHTLDRSFPPDHTQTHTRAHYDHVLDSGTSTRHGGQGLTSGSDSGVLLLSNGHPIPARGHSHASPSRPLRRSPYGSGLGGSVSGTGYAHNELELLTMGDPMDALGPNGNGNANGTTNGNSNTRCGPPISDSPSFPCSYYATAIAPAPAYTRLSPVSYTVPSHFPSAAAASASSGASCSNYSYPPGPSSNTSSTVNSISNIMNTSSSVSGSASSASSSPPMPTRDTPYTPYTPLPPLSPLPPAPTYSPAGMDWTPTASTSISTSAVVSKPGSDTDLLSPRSDMGTLGLEFDDMNMRWVSGHYPYTRHGLTHGYGPADGTGTGSDPATVRVKIEPDIVGVDVDSNYTADDSNTYAYTPYRAPMPLRPRYLTDDGCMTPNANTFSNPGSDSANNNFATNTTVNNDNNNYNNAYSYFSTSPSANSNPFHGYTASTSIVTRTTHGHDHGTYATTVGNSPYHNAPQLSPDSPTPSYRTDPILGYAGSAPTAQMNGHGNGHGQGSGYVSIVHHPPGQFSLHPPHGRHGGVGHSGLGGQGGHGHGQTAASSSWAGSNHTVRLSSHQQHQDHLLQQQQSQAQTQAPASYTWTHGNNSNDSGALQFPAASPTVRRPDLPPPSLQSSFSPLYYANCVAEDFGMNEIDTFAAQQAQMNGIGISGVDEGVMMPYYGQAQAPISGMDFYALPHEQQQQLFQEYAPIQPLQAALSDPCFVDRGDGSLVEHYLRHVRPVQYFFLEERLVELLRCLAIDNEAVRNAICSVASVHKRQMREGSSSASARGSTTPSPPQRASLMLPTNDAGVPEGDDGNAYYDRTRLALGRLGPDRLTKAEAMAGLQCISSFLFCGGVGGWDFFLNIACQWVETVLSQWRRAGDAYLLDKLTGMKREDELGSFIVRTTMWFEVLASVTMVRTPRFLDVYRKLFAPDGARIVEVDGEAASSPTEAEFSMLKVMGCDNMTFLALAEISALAAWKEEETKTETLSSVELVKRGFDIEQRYLRAIYFESNAESGTDFCRDGMGPGADSLENRRRLTADIFRASARLYLHTVLSGDKPSVREIREGVRETIEALQRVPVDPKSLRRSVVRSVVFPICLAGCMTDAPKERSTLKQFLEGESGAGNCGEVVKVMETVWERRDSAQKRGRGGRRVGSEHVGEVSWRDILREREGGVPLLLV